MSSGIYAMNEGGELIEMREQPCDSEELLQEMLVKHPNLLAGDQMIGIEPRRWLMISSEMSFSLEEEGEISTTPDPLFLDQDGVPTLALVKRSSDAKARQEIVGRMIDFAARTIAYWPVERIISAFKTSCERNNLNPGREIAAFLGVKPESSLIRQFWDRVRVNLRAGKIRMIFVSDKIPSELRRIVEFLNQQMDPVEVLAVEVKHYGGKSLKTLVPRLIGQTAESQQRKTAKITEGSKWDEQSFFEELSKKDKGMVDTAKNLLYWSMENATRIWWGEGEKGGSFVPVLSHNGVDHQLFALWTYGTLEIYFYWYKFKEPFKSEKKRLELLKRLNSIEWVRIPEEAINKRPNISLSILKNESSIEELIKVLDWVVDEIKKS